MFNLHGRLTLAMAVSLLIMLPADAQEKSAKSCCKATSCHDTSSKDPKTAAKCSCGKGKAKCGQALHAPKTGLAPASDPWRFAGLFERLGWTDQVSRSMIIEPRINVRPGF
jgi:hypothetical protein